jgi:hypothetical protein
MYIPHFNSKEKVNKLLIDVPGKTNCVVEDMIAYFELKEIEAYSNNPFANEMMDLIRKKFRSMTKTCEATRRTFKLINKVRLIIPISKGEEPFAFDVKKSLSLRFVDSRL